MSSKSPCQWLREKMCAIISHQRSGVQRRVMSGMLESSMIMESSSQHCSQQSGAKTRNYSILSVTDITLVIYFATGYLFRVVFDETVWFSDTNKSIMWSKTQTLVVAQLGTKSELFIFRSKKLMFNNHYWLTSNHVNYC